MQTTYEYSNLYTSIKYCNFVWCFYWQQILIIVYTSIDNTVASNHPTTEKSTRTLLHSFLPNVHLRLQLHVILRHKLFSRSVVFRLKEKSEILLRFLRVVELVLPKVYFVCINFWLQCEEEKSGLLTDAFDPRHIAVCLYSQRWENGKFFLFCLRSWLKMHFSSPNIVRSTLNLLLFIPTAFDNLS